MKRITRFCIRKLHGFRTIDIPIVDNTLILVGENGSGKTTIMRLLYFFLTGQWTSMAAYDFQSVHLDIDTKSYDLTRADITKHPGLGERRSLLHRLPPHVRRRFFDLSNQSDPGALRELERLCIHYDLPVSEVFKDITSETRPLSKQLTKILSALQTSFGTNLLYWPTYRRIEHDLEKILGGLDVSERHRRSLRTHSGQHDYTELVEFGMKDVEVAIANTRTELDQFASVQLNNLSFSYLDDIVEQLDESVDLQQIRDVTSATINKILARIQEPILSVSNKERLKAIINDVKLNPEPNVRSRVICHYFTKLMAFHSELEAKESKIANFCETCNRYMVDKEFKYSTSNFDFTIDHHGTDGEDRTLELSDLSSGEKQIVSVFCHLYLSGEGNHLVLIDEPELSLSVPWQRTFLTDIRDGQFCSGLVAATHSPFVYDNRLRQYARGLGELH